MPEENISVCCLGFIDNQNVHNPRFPAVGFKLLVVIAGPRFNLPLWNKDNVILWATLQDILVDQMGKSRLPASWRTQNLCQTSKSTGLRRCNDKHATLSSLSYNALTATRRSMISLPRFRDGLDRVRSESGGRPVGKSGEVVRWRTCTMTDGFCTHSDP